MAEHFRDSDFRSFENFGSLPNAHREDYAAESELLRSANTLPTLSSRLRARVLDAATSAYRQARRWALARQAASFLSVCLLASFVLSPFANMPLPSFASSIDVASLETLSSPQQPHSAWTLRHDREFLGLPREVSPKPEVRSPKPADSHLVARSESSAPRDKLLTALHTSDGWANVEAFQAVRSRSHSTLQRAFAAN